MYIKNNLLLIKWIWVYSGYQHSPHPYSKFQLLEKLWIHTTSQNGFLLSKSKRSWLDTFNWGHYCDVLNYTNQISANVLLCYVFLFFHNGVFKKRMDLSPPMDIVDYDDAFN